MWNVLFVTNIPQPLRPSFERFVRSLPCRVRRCLDRGGIRTWEMLLAVNADDLLQQKNVGLVTVRVLNDAMLKYGYKLKGNL